MNKKHGMYRHGMSRTRPYRIWEGMFVRCNNKKYNGYKDYGGRGIKVCDRWKDFVLFWEDMKAGYNDHMSIDRIDNEKGYSKENCRWVSKQQQNKNRRTVPLFYFNRRMRTIPDIAKMVGINRYTLRERLLSGKPLKEALKVRKPKYVIFDSRRNNWRAQKRVNGKYVICQAYKTKREAEEAISVFLNPCIKASREGDNYPVQVGRGGGVFGG